MHIFMERIDEMLLTVILFNRHRSEEIIFLQLDCRLSVNNLEEAIAVAVDGCRKMKVYMEAAMKKYMQEALESQV
jgi:hypothetical protein